MHIVKVKKIPVLRDQKVHTLEHLVVKYVHNRTDDPVVDTLQIGNIIASVAEWRKKLMPYFGLPDD